jgi:hypothetical protein
MADTVFVGQTKGTLSYRIKKVLKATDKKLRGAKRKFSEQIQVHAKRQCLSLCVEMGDKLPRELRNVVSENPITEQNATFYDGLFAKSKVKLANGCSNLQHCFDADYTGCIMHMEQVEELNHKGVLFDFRHRRALLHAALKEYTSIYGFKSIMHKVGVTLNTRDLKDQEPVVNHLNDLFELHKGTHISVFIEADGKTQIQINRSFRQVIRYAIIYLDRLKNAGYEVTVVMNPSYVRCNVKVSR